MAPFKISSSYTSDIKCFLYHQASSHKILFFFSANLQISGILAYMRTKMSLVNFRLLSFFRSLSNGFVVIIYEYDNTVTF